MPDINIHIDFDINIPLNIFYSAMRRGCLRHACSTLFLDDLIPNNKGLLTCMESQGSKSQSN